LAAVKVCELLWHLKYGLCYVLKHDPKNYRRIGTLIHLVLAYHFASVLPESERPSWFYDKDLQTELEEQGRGYPDLILRAKEVLLAFRAWLGAAYPDGDPWTPLHIEEEFTATIGQVDPTGHDEEIEVLVSGPGEKPRFERRRLNDEVVSCRPDLIVESDGLKWVIDHKSAGGAWGKNKDRLERWKEDGPFSLDWQIMVNLHIVRQHMPVEGFVIQRLKREPPWDFDRHVVGVPRRAYQKTPSIMRALVREEIQLRNKIARGQLPIASLGWACLGRYGACDFREVCRAQTVEQAKRRLETEYVIEPR
jgi:hypothetical protein